MLGLFTFTNVQADGQVRYGLSFQECKEGGEFIRNAALSRDNGINREFFLQKIRDDLLVIRSFPPELRWFAKDDVSERMLLDATIEVFDSPLTAQRHEILFVDVCMQSPEWRLRS